MRSVHSYDVRSVHSCTAVPVRTSSTGLPMQTFSLLTHPTLTQMLRRSGQESEVQSPVSVRVLRRKGTVRLYTTEWEKQTYSLGHYLRSTSLSFPFVDSLLNLPSPHSLMLQ